MTSNLSSWHVVSLKFGDDIKREFPGTPSEWKGLLKSANSNFTINSAKYESTKKALFKWCEEIGFIKYGAPFDYFEQNKNSWFNISIHMSLKLKPDSTQHLAYLKLFFICGFLEDFLEYLVETQPNESKSLISEIAELFGKFLEEEKSQKDKTAEIIIRFPILKTIFEAYADFEADCVKNIPNYRQNSSWLEKDVIQWIQGVGELPKITTKMDLGLFFKNRMTYPIPGLLLLANGLQIDAILREDIGFDRFLTLHRQIIASINDLHGSTYKIKPGNVLHYYLGIGKSIPEALDALRMEINKMLVDFENAKTVLRESFSDLNKDMVERIIEIISLSIDGHILCFKTEM